MQKIFNEFSSGALDITAIRDFVKMIYDRGDISKKPKALLLFGDASFDFKNHIYNGNMVPTFESYEYNNSVSSYCSDDYYVILGDIEGYWPKDPGSFKSMESMDMGVGRLPAKTTYEADVMVDKCIHYKTNSNKGEWRSSLTFLGDDEDGDVHFIDSEKLTDLSEKEFPPANINKIYCKFNIIFEYKHYTYTCSLFILRQFEINFLINFHENSFKNFSNLFFVLRKIIFVVINKLFFDHFWQ